MKGRHRRPQALRVQLPRKRSFRSREADARRATKSGGIARRSLARHGQADLAAERSEARIVLVAPDEGVGEEVIAQIDAPEANTRRPTTQ